jgi:hypothetical protein
MNFTLSLLLGAFLLAIWLDARFEGSRPTSIGRRIVHVAASCVLLQLAAFGAGLLDPESGGVARALVVVLAVLLPAFVYTFVSALWMLRTLAEAGFARR